MAIIAPFKGFLYNPDKISSLSEVTTPPYDVISNAEREDFYKRHPNNVIRLIFNRPEPDDQNGNNQYTRAAGFFRSWIQEGVLRRDSKPALYLIETNYTSEGVSRTRLGFITLVRLEDFDQGGIIPHEKTFSATKADRLELMRASGANFCPIWSVFSDPEEAVSRPFETWAKDHRSDFDFHEANGFQHRLWRVTDADLCRQIGETLKARPLYIADGHHRYETALNYRNEVLQGNKALGSDAPCNYVLMYLCSMQDPGLALRPVHRLVCNVSQDAMTAFAENAKDYFEVTPLSVAAADDRRVMLEKIRSEERCCVMGAVLRGQDTGYMLKAKEGVMDRLFTDTMPGPLRKLDVIVATKLVIENVLGISSAEQDDPKRVRYTSRTEKVFHALNEGKSDVALIMNPTRLSDMEEISDAGLIMPRKSTYFFPKVPSGLVINKIHEIGVL